jgi:hypothetical protein
VFGCFKSICCGYGTKGTSPTGYDCVHIPGAVKTGTIGTVKDSNICGRSNGLVTAAGTTAATVCSEYNCLSLLIRTTTLV